MQLAQRGEGFVNPNPLVGAVIVRDGAVVAEGWHERYGDLHAERNAFRKADAQGVDCKGTTMYVTLEPCCHHGHQPPCTDAIMEHGVSRVVVGLTDPNPLVAGKGLDILRNAGIEVEVVEDETLIAELCHQNRVFLKFITRKMPWVVAKWAMTLDGKICTRTGDSKWVSCEESRKYVHHMRANLKAIMCGIGTVLADDPMLNCRLEQEESGEVKEVRQPVRIVADRQLRIPLDSRLVQTCREIPLIVACSTDADEARKAALESKGVTVWQCDSLRDLMARCAAERIDGILLEGGGILNEAMMREHLIDEVFAFISPKITGGKDAKTPVEGRGVELMSDSVELRDLRVKTIGSDILVQGLCLQE